MGAGDRVSGGTHIRAMHPYAFRSGEWARIRGTAMLPVREGEPDRACYLVRFSDGVDDFWPVDDVDYQYEFGFKGIEVP